MGLIRKTLAAVGLTVLAFALAFPPGAPELRAQGLEGEVQSASDDAPPAPEGPFADNFTFSNPPVPAPSTVFQTLEGAAVSLADFRGKVVLVNFWATWCVPCVREMPNLERLHQALAGEGLVVLAVSNDRGGSAVVNPFLARLDLQHLPVFLDPKGGLAQAFALKGLPTTFVIGRDGRVLAGLIGPAEWDSPESLQFLRHYLNQETGPIHTSG
jgi:thiol-disulfide isomerase/thioredoxin